MVLVHTLHLLRGNLALIIQLMAYNILSVKYILQWIILLLFPILLDKANVTKMINIWYLMVIVIVVKCHKIVKNVGGYLLVLNVYLDTI